MFIYLEAACICDQRGLSGHHPGVQGRRGRPQPHNVRSTRDSGLKALVAGPLKKLYFFAASLNRSEIYVQSLPGWATAQVCDSPGSGLELPEKNLGPIRPSQNPDPNEQNNQIRGCIGGHVGGADTSWRWAKKNPPDWPRIPFFLLVAFYPGIYIVHFDHSTPLIPRGSHYIPDFVLPKICCRYR